MLKRDSSVLARQPCFLRCSKATARARLYEFIVEGLKQESPPLHWRFVKPSSRTTKNRVHPAIMVIPAGADRVALVMDKIGADVRVSPAEPIDPRLEQTEYADLVRFSFEPIHDLLHEKLSDKVGRLVLFCPRGTAGRSARRSVSSGASPTKPWKKPVRPSKKRNLP